MGLFESLQEAKQLFGIVEKKKPLAKQAEVVVIPWWIERGFPDLQSAIEVELDKVRAIVSPIVIPAGTPDEDGVVWPFDIRADAHDILRASKDVLQLAERPMHRLEGYRDPAEVDDE